MENFWKPVSKAGLIVFVVAALVFWIIAFVDDDNFLILDYVNLPFHEFGHVFFEFFGWGIGFWGGTIMQLAIPFGIAIYFCLKGESTAFAFSAFWFGENFLNIATYIADARRMRLPLVGGGIHDWNTILSNMDMLKYDTLIAGIVKTFGWLIMISSVVWLVVIAIKNKSDEMQ
jgi:hypothetical protein